VSAAGRGERPFIEFENAWGGFPRTHGEHTPSVTTGRNVQSRNGFAAAFESRTMPFPRPEVDIRSPPDGFPELVDWLERWSYRLVLLEEYSLPEIRAALTATDRSVRAHRITADTWVGPLRSAGGQTGEAASVVLSDHEWFETSLEQFWWFFRVVEREDHGGHRQALGQYGRVFGEALRRHLADERALEGRHSATESPLVR
jgi:hypothetical protein